VTVYEVAADGVNVRWQDATPVVPVAANVQLPEPPNAPDVGEAVKLTDPVGVVAPVEAVSVTVAVQVVALPVLSDAGEHETPVDVGSTVLV
jgi:hypothetical protein